MDKFLIKGGKPLHGTVPISGAKNSALPVMAASLLTADKVTLHNIPKVRDLITMSKLLAFMSAKVSVTEIPSSDYVIEAVTLNDAIAPYELVKTMRASILTLGPAIARAGVAHVSLPGGCSIGARPVDLHLTALEKMGAQITMADGYIQAKAPGNGKLKGAHIVFEKITVTGTENILMAAALAEGETILENAAREPEITDLVIMLRKMGAKISGDDTSTLRIQGVEKLHGCEHSVIPDRIEAGTFLVAGAITGGDLTIENCAPEHLGAVIAKMQQAGVRIDTVDETSLRVRPAEKLVGVDMTTEEYPGFATDMQAQYMALDHAGSRSFGNHRNDLRESIPARQRNGSHGRQYFDRCAARCCARTGEALGHYRAGFRSSRQRRARARRPRRQRRDHHRPRLSYRPRLRTHRRKAESRRRDHRTRSRKGIAPASLDHP